MWSEEREGGGGLPCTDSSPILVSPSLSVPADVLLQFAGGCVGGGLQN